MQTIQSTLEQAFRTAIKAAFGLDADPLVTPSQGPQFGDYQSNAAMGLSKALAQSGQKANPRQAAERILEHLSLGDLSAEKPTIAGPGFINVKLSPAWLARRLTDIAPDPRLGLPVAASPVKTVVDYSAPNVAKEMHVGHLRSTVIGDAIVRVLQHLGHEVIRQNHIGDWGTQFGRVMLGLWYAAAASQTGEQGVLEAWMTRAPSLRKRGEQEPPADQQRRLALARELLDEIQTFHQRWLDSDESDPFFLKFIETSFPPLDQLQALYKFASAICESEVAGEFKVKSRKHGETSLAALPSLIATFVQKQAEPGNTVEGVAWQKTVAATIDTCQQIYDTLGVRLTKADVYGESKYNDSLPGVVEELLRTGIAQRSEGAVAIFVEGYEAPLIIQKRDGGFGYATTDMAAVRYRVDQLHARRIIYVVGHPQSQHLAQIKAAAMRAGWLGDATFEHAAFGSVLGEDGKMLKTRSGDTVKLKDLLDEAEERGFTVARQKSDERGTDLAKDRLRAIGRAIGIGGIKYADLSKDRISDYIFNWDKMLAMDGNTAPYLQYAYARTQSIFRKGGVQGSGFRVQALDSPHELALAKHILRLGEVIDAVARDLKPHLLCTYLYDLATRFSGFFENCPVLQSEEPTRSSRLALCDLTARTMALGLDLLGIEHPEQM